MATSSIVENIRVNNPKLLEEYVAALELAEKSPVDSADEPVAQKITDPEELKQIMLRGIENWSLK